MLIWEETLTRAGSPKRAAKPRDPTTHCGPTTLNSPRAGQYGDRTRFPSPLQLKVSTAIMNACGN